MSTDNAVRDGVLDWFLRAEKTGLIEILFREQIAPIVAHSLRESSLASLMAETTAEKARADAAVRQLKAQDGHLDAEIARSEELGREVERLRVELNQMREAHGLELAAISTAAIMNTRDSFSNAEIDRTNPAWTAAYLDTRTAILREIALREDNEWLRGIIGLAKSAADRNAPSWQIAGILREADAPPPTPNSVLCVSEPAAAPGEAAP